MRIRFKSALLALFLGATLTCLLCGPPAAAQSLFATLTGTVSDSSGAVVPGADVTVTNANSGVARKLATNAEGFFNASSLPAGTYQVEVVMQGFRHWKGTGIVLNGGDSRTMTIYLTVAVSTTTIQVTETVTGVALKDTGEKAALISARDLEDLSLISRNATEFVKLLPGAVMQANGGVNRPSYGGETIGINNSSIAGNTGGLSSVTINGQSVDITQDGQHVFDPGASGAATPVNPNPDMISEVKVTTANFTAENAKGPVIVNTVTKAGGNTFHGSAYMYGRNSKWNANDAFNNMVGAPKPKSSYYYPGGNIGGPVVIPGTGFNRSRQKLFFFEGYENYHQTLDGGVARAFIMTPEMLDGDFSALSNYGSTVGRPTLGVVPTQPSAGSSLGFDQRAAAGCTITSGILSPECISPSAQALLKAYMPAPNISNPEAHNGYNYIQTFSVPQNSYQNMIRVDWNISDNTKVYATWSRQRETQNQPLGLWASTASDWVVPSPTNIIGANGSDFTSLSLVHVFSPTMTSETRFGYTKINFPNAPEDPTKVLRSSLPGFSLHGIYGNPAVPDITSWSNTIPNFGGANLGATYHPTMICYKGIPSVAQNLTKVIGTHTTKYGFYFEHVYNKQDNWGQYMGVLYYNQWSAISGNNYADMLMGIGMGSFLEQALPPPSQIAQNVASWYVQDDWKVTRRLTLQYGLRFEHYAKPYDATGFGLAIFDRSRYSNDPADLDNNTGVFWNKLDSSVPLSGSDSRFLFFSPRIGAAWDVFGTGNTVLRGGWGKYRFYDSVQSNNYTAPTNTAMGSVSWSCGQNDPLCPTWEGIDDHALAAPVFGSGLGPGLKGIAVVDPTDDEQPLVTTYVFSIDQRLPGKFLLELSYVGNHTDFMQANPNINAVPLGGLFDATCDITTSGCQQVHRPYLNYQNMAMSLTAGSSRFDSLQVSLLRNVGFLNMQANYTWSKALGAGPTINNGGLTGALPGYGAQYYRGVLPNNRAHVMNLVYVFSLPSTRRGHPIVRGVVNGWQISGITTIESGANLTAQSWNLNYGRDNGTDADGNTIFYDNIHTLGTPDVTLQPLVVCNPAIGLKPHQYITPACFKPSPTDGTLGTGGMPYLSGPMFWNSDLSLMKNFRISERQNLQVRFAAFNFMNHSLWSFTQNDNNLILHFGADGQVTNPNFGVAQYKYGRRIMEFGVKYSF
ncbi:MAG: carboxypeptidase regulatory-like domain-containing protein [Terriglobia bacterium]